MQCIANGIMSHFRFLEHRIYATIYKNASASGDNQLLLPDPLLPTSPSPVVQILNTPLNMYVSQFNSCL